jgi:glycine cleavage system aminomethyltransferase T
MHFHPEEQSLLIECSPGTIVVTGPKAAEFCERFCSHRVASVKADGKDTLAVTTEPRSVSKT